MPRPDDAARPAPDADSAPAAQWLHSLPAADASPVAAPVGSSRKLEGLLDMAWAELERDHLTFNPLAIDAGDIVAGLRHLDQLAITTEHDDVREYLWSSYLGVNRPDGDRYSARVPFIVLSQARLMHQAFELLRLDRHANAPTNRGWMNLFRRWGQHAVFNRWFDEFREQFTRQFVQFYDAYIRNRAEGIDLDPIPHPWEPGDGPEVTQVDRDEEAWAGLVAAHNIPTRSLRQHAGGVYRDTGIREARRTGRESSVNDSPDSGAPKPGHAAEDPGGPSGQDPGGPASGVPNA